jgi:hypothetical protein
VDSRVLRAGRESEAYIGLAVVRSCRVEWVRVHQVGFLGSGSVAWSDRAVWLPYQKHLLLLFYFFERKKKHRLLNLLVKIHQHIPGIHEAFHWDNMLA